MLHAKLRQEGFVVNVKVVERLYKEERLALRRRTRKKMQRLPPGPEDRTRRIQTTSLFLLQRGFLISYLATL